MSKFQVMIKENPGMMFVISFAIVAVINCIVFNLGNMFFPNQIVLGTFSIPRLWAVLLSGCVLSMFTVLLMPFITQWEVQQKRVMSPMELMAIYLLINGVGLYLLTRKSEFFGLGVSNWFVVVTLAIVLDLIQGMVMMQVEKMRTAQ